MLAQPFGNPFVNAAFGILDIAALSSPTGDAFEGRTGA
jgi:hypothetical protein